MQKYTGTTNGRFTRPSAVIQRLKNAVPGKFPKFQMALEFDIGLAEKEAHFRANKRKLSLTKREKERTETRDFSLLMFSMAAKAVSMEDHPESATPSELDGVAKPTISTNTQPKEVKWHNIVWNESKKSSTIYYQL